MNPSQTFHKECADEIELMASNNEFKKITRDWLNLANSLKYSYHFNWLGRPIIQYPQDIVAMQELIWSTRPDLIIETGIAHGGSLILSSSILALLDMADAIEKGEVFDPIQSSRLVLGIDIDIRKHNRLAIKNHFLSSRIMMLEGSSVDNNIINKVQKIASKYKKILVCLDSNHTHEHVLSELKAYAPLTSVGSYCVVFDTIIEDMNKQMFSNRPWGPGNNAKTAVWEYLKMHNEFIIDKSIENKLQITVSPDGYLKRLF